MRVLLWHGWLLEGSGSNIFTGRVAEALRSAGHDVLLVCQEPHPERYRWIDGWGTVDSEGPSALTANTASSSPGRCVLLRPRIGGILPVFVIENSRPRQFHTLLRDDDPDPLHRHPQRLVGPGPLELDDLPHLAGVALRHNLDRHRLVPVRLGPSAPDRGEPAPTAS